jgi:tRNA(Ile)-lysidine synthase
MKQDSSEDHGWWAEWLEQVRRRIRAWCAGQAGRSWVVAVSGGSDSVALLRALHALAPGLGLTLSVAHLDHGMRGEAARSDAVFVEGLAAELGLPCDLGSWRPKRAAHFEADGRQERYAWLSRIATARGASAVAVGHTRDDQAETILHRILRGTGLRGLGGMPSLRPLGTAPGVVLVRPLISVTRAELLRYLGAMGQSFREDVSNADPSRTRARIRHDLLPRLAGEYNPRVAEALVRLGTLAASSYRTLETRLLEIEQAVVVCSSNDRIEIRRDGLLSLPCLLRNELLRRVWRQAGWPERGMSAARWQRLAVLVRHLTIKEIEIGAGVTVATGVQAGDATTILLRCKAGSGRTAVADASGTDGASDPGEQVSLGLPGSVVWRERTIETVLDPYEPRDETVDLDRIVPPLYVRGPVPGDRFDPLGVGGHRQPLNDFFRNRKVPPADRARTPLLCDAGGIIWVVGHRIAERVKVRAETVRTLGLRRG